MLKVQLFTLGEAAPARGVGGDAGPQPRGGHRAVQRQERLQTRQRRRYEGPETGRMNKSAHIFRLPESLGAKTQLNGENRQGIQGGVVRDLRMRGAATGVFAARNGLAIGDLDRSAADLAAAAERHKDAMVSCDGGR